LHVMKNGQASAPTVCEAKPTEKPSATPQPATPQSDFERIAGDIKAQFERAFAGSSTATPAPAPAAPGVNVLQTLMQQFAGAQQSAPAAPASPFSGILNQVENAVLLAQIASFISYVKQMVSSGKVQSELAEWFGRLEDHIDTDAIVEWVEAQAEKNPSLEKALDAARDAFCEGPNEVHSATCDYCEETIRGIRYKCSVCSDFDLCQKCEKLEVHTEHAFLKIERPGVNWQVAPIVHHGKFLSDMTIPDGEKFVSGARDRVVKRWRIRNDGQRWQQGCKLVLKDASVPDGVTSPFPTSAAMDPIAANSFGDVQVSFRVPTEVGRYVAHYRMARPDGQLFGDRLWMEFHVEEKWSEQLERLVELGFDRELSRAALVSVDGDMARAVELLLGESH